MVVNPSPGLPPESNRVLSSEPIGAAHIRQDSGHESNLFALIGESSVMKNSWITGSNLRALLVLAVGVGSVLIAANWWSNQGETLDEAAIPTVAAPATTEQPRSHEPPTTEVNEIVVHVAGAVKSPGVMSIVVGSRVSDAVDKAGGPTADADLHSLNLAQVLQDGTSIVVPTMGQEPKIPAIRSPSVGGVDAAEPGSAAEVNINTASVEVLQQLNGVGPATAEAIVKWRNTNGAFESVDDLLNVPGIGPSKLDAIREDVVL